MSFNCLILASISLTYFVDETKNPMCFLMGSIKDSTIGLIIGLTKSIFQKLHFKTKNKKINKQSEGGVVTKPKQLDSYSHLFITRLLNRFLLSLSTFARMLTSQIIRYIKMVFPRI
ncbi:hypothetical protein HanIR_Chr11g0527701 [Helianthus annuus]|nr:hypothetical protein HanIR_Chr11g0527701 [Helianthus annuus]